MRKILLGLLALAITSGIVYAQQSNTNIGTTVNGAPINRSTKNSSVTITTSGTFQQILASTMVSNTTIRQAITIQNNNAAGPNCWINWGVTANAATSNSILLPVGGSYTRYWPFVPSDALQATCGANSTTLYVDTQ